MNYGGIDVGIDGAISAIDSSGNVLVLEDTPTFRVTVGKKNKRDYNVRKMADLLLRCRDGDLPPTIGLELVHAFPMKKKGKRGKKGKAEGVVSMFSFGRGLGLWEGMIVMADYKYTKTSPQTWKKVMLKDMDKSKDASRLRALQLFPDQDLHLKKHHGRAEALLIAEYMRRTA